jgi:probable HAF family extracellular repeat protein
MARTSQAVLRLLVVLFFFGLASLAAAQSYTVTDLGGVNAIGSGISPNGNVVGQSGSFGFFWSPSRGLLKLAGLPGGNSSQANGINANGVIAGESTVNVEGYELDHAVIWTNGKIQDLGVLTTLGQSWASGINAAGQVAGSANPLDSNPHAFLWTSASGIQDLGTLPGGSYSTALAINRFGQIVGYSDLADGNSVAFVWSKARGMLDLATLPGGGTSAAIAINDLGQIAGGSGCGAACSHAVLWSKKAGSIQDLGLVTGSTFSSAYGINNKGQVVGAVSFSSGPNHAFVWSQAAGMQDLNNLIPANSGWMLQSADAINDSGQITGQGAINGVTHTFLLTPAAGSESLAAASRRRKD